MCSMRSYFNIICMEETEDVRSPTKPLPPKRAAIVGTRAELAYGSPHPFCIGAVVPLGNRADAGSSSFAARDVAPRRRDFYILELYIKVYLFT